MSEPLIIEPTVQKYSGDCALCCLTMLLGVNYLEVRQQWKNPKVREQGLTTRQMLWVAGKLGIPLKWRETDEPPDDDEIAILDLQRMAGGKWEGHVVMFIKGVIYNPSSGWLYTDVDGFLKDTKWSIVGYFYRAK